MIKKALTVSIIVLLTVVFVKAIDVNVYGKPRVKGKVGFRVWKSGNTWHMRMKAKEKSKVFSGTIHCIGSGRFTGAWAVAMEKRRDYGGWNSSMIRFNTKAKKGVDGFDFTATCYKLKFDLMIAGMRRPKRIYIGAQGVSPYTVPFQLRNR